MTDYANMSQSDLRAEEEEPARCDSCNRIVEHGQTACECGARKVRGKGWMHACPCCGEWQYDKGPCDICAEGEEA